jgi:LPXTG-motif cell wall-anchored protein
MRLMTLAALVVALAFPAAALAQGAGDEQYQDPFGDEQSQQEPTQTATPAPPTQAPAQPSQAAPAPTVAPAPAPAPTSGRQLPYTGGEAGWLALAGAVLLASGVALRRRADHQR